MHKHSRFEFIFCIYLFDGIVRATLRHIWVVVREEKIKRNSLLSTTIEITISDKLDFEMMEM